MRMRRQRAIGSQLGMLGALLTAITLALLPSLAIAADSFKMGVVDPQTVLEKSKSGKRALDTLKEYAGDTTKITGQRRRRAQKSRKTTEGAGRHPSTSNRNGISKANSGRNCKTISGAHKSSIRNSV